MNKFPALCLTLLLAAVMGAAPDAIDTGSLLDQMISPDRLARAFAPGTRLVQFSSYDRRAEAGPSDVGWWSNADIGHYLRSEKTERGVEFVMAEAEGPGVLTRIWSANPGSRIYRIYIDDEPEPVVEAQGDALLSGRVAPWAEPFAGKRSMGANFIFPIPFSRSIKVTVARRLQKNLAADPMMYYQVDLRLYPAGTPVRSFSWEELRSLSDRVARVSEVLQNPELLKPGLAAAPVEVELAPGAEGLLYELSGPGAIKWLEIGVKAGDEALAEALARTLLTMSFDGKLAVAVPLGDFFGASPGAPELNSLMSSIAKEDGGARLTSRWVMPYREGATIRLFNQSSKRLRLEAEIVARDWQWEPDSLYFHAAWRERTSIPTRPFSDMTMLDARGRGHFVGLEMNVRNPMEFFWWGEGDEKIFVDGEDFPSIFGTGTEDYFGYAWCFQYLKFTHAYHGVSVPTSEWLIVPQALALPFLWEATSRATAKNAVVSQYRWQVLDAVPFDESLRFDMEIWHHRETEIDVNATAYWYADAGASDDGSIPDLRNRETWATP